jgi:hypothetical protein
MINGTLATLPSIITDNGDPEDLESNSSGTDHKMINESEQNLLTLSSFDVNQNLWLLLSRFDFAARAKSSIGRKLITSRSSFFANF